MEHGSAQAKWCHLCLWRTYKISSWTAHSFPPTSLHPPKVLLLKARLSGNASLGPDTVPLG